MSPTADTLHDERSPASPPRPLYWSIRRELWENRSLTIAPAAAAAVLLFGFLLSTNHLHHRMDAMLALDVTARSAALAKPYSIAAAILIVTTLIVAVFYCLDALHGERRDRSILFWKSLPVSDLTTVLAKILIPLAVLPLIACAAIIALQLTMLLLSTLILATDGPAVTMLWTQVPLARMTGVLFYGLATLELWYAPIYGWLLVVSAWARRATLLWAILPPLALCVVEKIAFDTSNVANLLFHRFTGSYAAAFVDPTTPSVVPQLDPLKFLGSPGLWAGLAFAAACLAAAVWLRRTRGPI
jgi:ABC-2 type transport system permease protein